ncbi:hypothetical protein DUI87_11052 [Hirundo rustica rustica]|uniref:Uncharacterized protein n=1 Tax=Hirundo rustica rustica TaxID=333673 RepID=A0A3M0KFV0_HIRRU|nr:hypothetical protein DUI87_11052 [Hirundo rustica rustica]
MASKVQRQYEIALVVDSQTKDMAGESVCYEDRPNQWEFFYITKEDAERKRQRQVFPAGQVEAEAELWEVQAKPGEPSSLLGLVLDRNPVLVLSLRLQAQEDGIVGDIK